MDTKNTKPSIDDLQTTISFLKATIPQLDDLFESMDEHGGWLPLNDKAINFLYKLPSPWCTLYEDEKYLNKFSTLACFQGDEVNQDSINTLLTEATACLNLSDSEFKSFIEDFESNEHDHSTEQIQQGLQIIYALITQFFNFLALMVHARSMCRLIANAKDGDEIAFCQAVHIDRTVLQLPFFQNRLLKSQFSNDEKFLNMLAMQLKKPILKSNYKYRTLMLTLAMLDDQNMLDRPLEDLLDICSEIGVTHTKHGVIDDTDKLGKLLREYENRKKEVE